MQISYAITVCNEEVELQSLVTILLKNKIKSLNIYRTYDFEKARKSQVFLESVKIDRELSKMLLEQYE